MQQSTIERLPTVLRRLAVSKSTLYALIKRGAFKPPLKLGPRASGWLSEDVDEFLRTRIKECRPGTHGGTA